MLSIDLTVTDNFNDYIFNH